MSIRLLAVEIWNIGPINHLAHTFEKTGAPTFFQGGNGVGKTTLLECISLIGHLPTMDSVSSSGHHTRSVLATLESRLESRGNLYAWALGHGLTTSKRHDIAASSAMSEASKGLIRLRLRFRGQDFDLHVLVDGAEPLRTPVVEIAGEESLDPSTGGVGGAVEIESLSDADVHPVLTQILSQSWGEENPPDAELERFFLVLHDATAPEYAELVTAIARGRTFATSDGGWKAGSEFPTGAVTESGPSIKVAYVNTDLNDFGRGNDLRESPKNLPSSFTKQMVKRLRAPREGADLAPLDAINECLERVLPSHTDAYSDAYAFGDGLHVAALTIPDDGPVSIKARRGGSERTGYAVDFMSAGENEVFFLLLMALILGHPLGEYVEREALPPQESDATFMGILLLDEPDLHLANHAKTQLLREILRICAVHQIQVIACSHSIAPVIALKDVEGSQLLTLYRRRAAPRLGEGRTTSENELAITDDPRYVGYIDRSAWYEDRSPAVVGKIAPKARLGRVRTGFAAYRRAIGRQIEAFLSPHFGSTRLRRIARAVAGINAWLFVLGVPLLAGVAIFNDVLDVFFGVSGDWVDSFHAAVTIMTLVTVIVFAATFGAGFAGRIVRLRLRRSVPPTMGNRHGSHPLAGLSINVLGSFVTIFLLWLFAKTVGIVTTLSDVLKSWWP